MWSAIGVLPLSIHFGYDVMEEFLKGGNSIDQHLLAEKDIKVQKSYIIEKSTTPVRLSWFLQNLYSEALSKSNNSILSGFG